MVKCAYSNVLESATVTLAAGTEDPYYPLYRLSDRNIGRLFKPIAFSKYAVTAGMLSQSGLAGVIGARRYWRYYKTDVADPGNGVEDIEIHTAAGKYAVTAGMLSAYDLASFDAANCLDGTASIGFYIDTADPGAYLQIDLGAGNEQAITKARMKSGGTNTNAVFDIEYSDDGVAWTKAATGLDVDGAYQWFEITWTVPFSAANCVDGDTGTVGFDTDSAAVGSYLQVDLGDGNDQAFRKVRVYVSGANANAVWAVQYSDDAVSWGTSGAGLDVDGALGWHELVLSDAGAHRYWRLYKTDDAEPGNGHTEVEFYLGGVAETITIKVDQHILVNSFATSVFDGGATGITGIAHDPDGSIWVTCVATDKVYNIAKDGTLISSFDNSVFDATASNVRDIAVDPDGSLWVVDPNKDTIYHIQKDGTLIGSFATSLFGAYQVQGLAYGYDGTLWATDASADKICNIQKDGTLISSFLTSVFDPASNLAAGIDCDPDGSLWVVDAGTTKIYHIEADGTLISSFTTLKFTSAATYPEGIARDPDGTLWVADPQTDKIYNVKDYATVQSVDRLLIPAGHNLQDVLVTVESSETDSGYAEDMEFTGTPGVISQALTTGQKQYIKVTFTSPVDVPELAELFLSPTYNWERDPDLLSGPLEPVHDVLVERTAGGQTRFLTGGAPRRQRSYSLKKCGPEQRENLLSLYSEWAGHKPFWLCDTDGQWIFGRLRAPLGLKQLEHGVYSLEFQFEEALS